MDPTEEPEGSTGTRRGVRSVPIVPPARDGLESDRVQQGLLIVSSLAAALVLALVSAGILLFV